MKNNFTQAEIEALQYAYTEGLSNAQYDNLPEIEKALVSAMNKLGISGV